MTEKDLLKIIRDRKNRQKDVAIAYLKCSIPIGEWAIVNGAIVKRWSMSGLTHVKKMAWKLALDNY